MSSVLECAAHASKYFMMASVKREVHELLAWQEHRRSGPQIPSFPNLQAVST